jgi:hypothetical protein
MKEENTIVKEEKTIQEETVLNDLRTILGTMAGKRFIGALLASSGRDRDPYRAGSFDATAYELGRLSVASSVAALVKEIDPFLLAECEIELENLDKQG